MAEDVQWEAWADNSAQKADVPWLRLRHGKAGAAEFFQLVAQFQIHDFKVLSLMANDRQVAAEFVIDATPARSILEDVAQLRMRLPARLGPPPGDSAESSESILTRQHCAVPVLYLILKFLVDLADSGVSNQA
jgi:hypothetical protein